MMGFLDLKMKIFQNLQSAILIFCYDNKLQVWIYYIILANSLIMEGMSVSMRPSQLMPEAFL